MDDLLDLLIDLHKDGSRQGPGGDDETRLAIQLSGLGSAKKVAVADIGCGTGAATLCLAKELDAVVTAIDLQPAFLEKLKTAATRSHLDTRIETRTASMDALPFENRSLDAIWSEGAIYNIGFENGIRNWHRFLKPGGILAVSELTWLTHERPAELSRYWAEAYSEVGTASAKMAVLEQYGYAPIAYFPLPKQCWLANYYRPLEARFADFLARNGTAEAAVAIVAQEQEEIALYERYADFVSYGYYVARKTAA